MWAPLATELGIPWRAAEAMHWQLGEADMARRAGVTPFSLSSASSAPSGPSGMTSAVPPGVPPSSNLPGTGPLPSPYAQYPPQYLPPQQQRPEMLLAGEYPHVPPMAPLPPHMREPQMRDPRDLRDPRDPVMAQHPSMKREDTGGRLGVLPGLPEVERGGRRRRDEEEEALRGPLPRHLDRYADEGASSGRGR